MREMGSRGGNSSQNREESSVNFLVLSRIIRLGEHSLILLTLGGFNFKNN